MYQTGKLKKLIDAEAGGDGSLLARNGEAGIGERCATKRQPVIHSPLGNGLASNHRQVDKAE